MRFGTSAARLAAAPWHSALLSITILLASLSTVAAQDTSSAGEDASSSTFLGGTRKLCTSGVAEIDEILSRLAYLSLTCHCFSCLCTVTSSVAYCSPPIAILVTDLNLTYFPGNSTLEFDLSAASTQDDLNVSIALSVNAYGIGVFDVSIDLCSFASGILCPLPKYQFSGGGIFPVPSDVGEQVPAIAYNIPDLEAVATVQLTDTSTNNVVGCVQATLSNGHTARQSGAKWATVGLALLALFSALLHASIAQSVGAAQWRIVDVMLAIQQPAITALLSLNYPIVFLEYGSNFAWSLGLVDIPSLQSSITQTRTNTGGHDTAVFGKNLTAVTGRKLNPFSDTQSASSSGFGKSINSGSLGLGGVLATNENGTSNVLSAAQGAVASAGSNKLSIQPLSSYANIHDFVKRAQYAPNTGPGGTLNTGGNSVSLPLVTGNVSVDGGIGQFAERNDVAPSNAFLTVFVSMLILLGIILAAVALVYLIACAARFAFYHKYRYQGVRGHIGHWGRRVSQPREFFDTILLAMIGRYLLIITPVYLIFAFWQWFDGDSWVGHLVAALVLVMLLLALASLLVPMFIHVRRSGSPDTLYHKEVAPARGSHTAKRWGNMAHPFRSRFFWFSLAFLVWWFVRACFISFAQGHGTRQAIGLLVAEVLLFLTLCIFRVGRDKKSDFVFIFMCFGRIAAWAVCIAFIPAANVRTIPRAVVAYILLVVTAVPIIYLFVVTLVDLVSPLLRRKRRDVDHNLGEKDPEKTTVEGSSQDEMSEQETAQRHSTPTLDTTASREH